jgi:hypothetical protein
MKSLFTGSIAKGRDENGNVKMISVYGRSQDEVREKIKEIKQEENEMKNQLRDEKGRFCKKDDKSNLNEINEKIQFVSNLFDSELDKIIYLVKEFLISLFIMEDYFNNDYNDYVMFNITKYGKIYRCLLNLWKNIEQYKIDMQLIDNKCIDDIDFLENYSLSTPEYLLILEERKKQLGREINYMFSDGSNYRDKNALNQSESVIEMINIIKHDIKQEVDKNNG